MSWRYKGGFVQEYFNPASFGWSTLFATGDNRYGQLGIKNLVYKSSPTQVGVATDWKYVSQNASAYCMFAQKNSGTIFSWGQNGQGALGLNDVVYRSSPVQIGALNYWYSIANIANGGAAITNAGTLWTWGTNVYGQLGNNTAYGYKSSPTQVGTSSTWSKLGGGVNFALAIRTNGSLWSWGRNNQGQLGLRDIANRSSPVQVGSQTTWSKVFCGQDHTVAIKTDGTLWAWGYNINGQLGDNTIIARSSPVQIGNLTNWLAASAGEVHTVALKTDGTLWAWGYNSAGPLGQNDTIQRSSPVQVGGLASWIAVSCGKQHTAALKNDGTLWTWGRNDAGQLGDNTAYGNNKSSPVQIGSESAWSIVAACYNTTFACR